MPTDHYASSVEAMIVEQMHAIIKQCDLPDYHHSAIASRKDARKVFHTLCRTPYLEVDDYNHLARPVLDVIGRIEDDAKDTTCTAFNRAVLEDRLQKLLKAINEGYIRSTKSHNKFWSDFEKDNIQRWGKKRLDECMKRHSEWVRPRKVPVPYSPAPITRTINVETITAVTASTGGALVRFKQQEKALPAVVQKKEKKEKKAGEVEKSKSNSNGCWLVLNDPSKYLSHWTSAQSKCAQKGKQR